MILRILIFVEQADCRTIETINCVWPGPAAPIAALRNAYKFIETRKREPVCDMTAFV